MTSKYCSKCDSIKPLSEFYKRHDSKDGKQSWCKICNSRTSCDYRRTKKGLTSHIYANQQYKSKKRKHPPPGYTLIELQNWIFGQPNFNQLYDSWVASGYEKMLVPSPDRLDDNKPYTLDNLRLVTWQENKDKWHNDRINGINNKHSKAVIMLNLDNIFVCKYRSAREANRKTGISYSTISSCCNGKRKIAGGMKWEFA